MIRKSLIDEILAEDRENSGGAAMQLMRIKIHTPLKSPKK